MDKEQSLPFSHVEVDGDTFPNLPVDDVPKHVRNLRVMPMREDDIIIAAFPKCGTHWIWEVCGMLIDGTAEIKKIVKEEVMMEFQDVSTFADLPSPRVINSHLFPRQLSKELVTKKPRLIHVMRNPKDVTVSLYFHLKQIKGFPDLPFGVFASQFLQGGAIPGSFSDYFAYMKEMFQFRKDHPDVTFLDIFFEDSKKDPVACVERLNTFLGTNRSAQLCQDIADSTNFDKMKKADESYKNNIFTGPGKIGHHFKKGQGKLYRKGKVGDWKNYFTVALSEQFDQVLNEKLKDYNLKYQYSLD